MRTIATAAAAAIMSMALALPAFAQTSTSTGVASSADLACMSAAVDARESSVISARAAFHASIMAALDVRRAALAAAYTIANHRDRMVAIEAAIRSYAKASADARAKFSTDVKAAWNVFMTAKVGCHIDQGTSLKIKMKGDVRGDQGLHLGWFKHQMHSKAWMNGHVKLDLSN